MENDISSDKSVISVSDDQPENLVVKPPSIKMAYDEPYVFQEGSKPKLRKTFEDGLDEDAVDYGIVATEGQEEDVTVHNTEAIMGNTRAHDYFEMINESHGRCLLCNREIRRKKYNFQMHLQHRHPHVFQSIVPTSTVVKRRTVKPTGPLVQAAKEDCGGGGCSREALPPVTSKLNEALCTWICADLIPLHQIESEHFRRFVCTLNDGYDPLPPPAFTDSLLPEFEKRTEFNIMQELQSVADGVALCLDVWTCTKYDRPCLVLMANYVDRTWLQRTCCLGVTLLDKRHLFYSILGRVMESLKKYDVKLVTAVVANEHPDVVKACEQLDAVNYICVARQLQSFLLPLLNEGSGGGQESSEDGRSSVSTSLKSLVQVLNKTRRIATLLKESPSLWEHYCYLFENMHWPSPSAIPSDNPHRWNSTMPLLREVLKQVEFLRMASSQLHYEELFLSESEKSQLLDLVELLEPFEEAVGALVSRPFPLASMIIPVVVGIKARLKEMLNDALDKKKPDFFNVCTWVMDRMAILSAAYEKNPSLQAATFLDPRFKGFCLNQDDENLVVKRIADEMDALLHSDATAVTALNSSPVSAEQNPRSIFGCLFKGNADKTPVAEPDSLDYQEVRAIVCAYGKLQRLSMDADVLHYWSDKEQQKSFSILPAIARKYLGFVATASNSKYAFTKAGDILKDRCKALSARYAESLLFTNQNKRYFYSEPNS